LPEELRAAVGAITLFGAVFKTGGTLATFKSLSNSFLSIVLFSDAINSDWKILFFFFLQL
jgi:hypothetical protein